MPFKDFAAEAARLFDDVLSEGELRRIKAGDVDEANPTAAVEAQAVETYLFKGYAERAQIKDSDGRTADGTTITIFGASVTGLLGRRTTGGQGVNPWSAAFDSSFGGQVVGQDYVPTDTVPREGDEVRFINETVRHRLGILLESDPDAAVLKFAVNTNTS